MTKDLTQGNLIKNIITFSFPFLLSYFLQTLYGMADLFIVGQYNGASSISGVSIGSQFMHMVTVMLVSLSLGSVVMIGRYVGSHNEKQVNTVIGNSITLFSFLSLILLIALLCCRTMITTIMNTPIEAIQETENYLTICFLGIPFIIAYNVVSSIFRGLGDSKTPMYFIFIACLSNIVLDYAFVGFFHMHATGAALATVIAQAVSVVISLLAIKSKKLIHIHKTDLKIQQETLQNILKIGVPVSLQDGFIQVSFLIITIIANSRGVEVSAAVGVVEKIISFLFLVPSAMMSTVSTIVSQAIGANNKPLARKTLSICSSIAFTFGIVIAICFQFISQNVLSLFTNDATVISLGTSYMHSYVFDCAIAGIHFCLSGFFVASGYPFISFLNNVISIIICRVPGAYLASIYYPDTLFPMGLAAPMGGIIQILICVFFFIRYRKQDRI